MIIQIAEWTPDQPDHMNGLTVCRNVIPRTTRSYGPASAIGTYSGATTGTGRVCGAFAAKDNSGNVNLFAGTTTTLERLTSASTSWEDVSGATYAAGTEGRWSFAQYGLRVIATDFVDNVQSYVIDSSTDFADLGGSPPKAKYVAVWRDFVVLARLATDPQAVHWSEIDNPASWPTVGSAAAAAAQSDRQSLVGDGGEITGIVGGLANADGVVLQERAVFKATYVGPPLIFTFDRIEGARGCTVPGSIVQVGGVVYYLSEDGFYACDGASSVPIGMEKVDRHFLEDVDATFLARMSAANDPVNKIVYWAYPGEGHVNGFSNKTLAYNWALKRWSEIEQSVELIFNAFTLGLNVDSAAAAVYNVDDSPYGPDSRFWAGGRALVGAFPFTLSTLLGTHRLGFLDEAAGNLAATIETGDLDLGEGKRGFYSGIRPIIDTTEVTASVGYRENFEDEPEYTTATAPAADGFCPARISTRFARAKIEIPADVDWDLLSGFEPRFKAEGTR